MPRFRLVAIPILLALLVLGSILCRAGPSLLIIRGGTMFEPAAGQITGGTNLREAHGRLAPDHLCRHIWKKQLKTDFTPPRATELSASLVAHQVAVEFELPVATDCPRPPPSGAQGLTP